LLQPSPALSLSHTHTHTHTHTPTHINIHAHTCVSILFSHIIGIDNHRPLSPQNVCKHRSQACSYSLLAETFRIHRRCNNLHIFLSSHQSSSQACRTAAANRRRVVSWSARSRPVGCPSPRRFRFDRREMRRRLAAAFRSKWLRCAMAALALSYAAECAARNGPYWETDVAYLHWSTDVPAVTVCPAASGLPADHLRPPPTPRLV